MAGFCAPWSDEDIYFADRIWTLIKSSERRELRDTLQRQQKLMINELNHRVRNILAIVRSVSRHARRHNRSPESYSDAMERRIQALAASHNLISGTTFDAAELKELLALELTPFHTHDRIKINGPDVYIRSDTAPILSLVFHELVTNSAKYGALSVETGTLTVDIEAAETGAKLLWREQGGPVVKAPNTLGFGSTLIKQAVPHEIGGTARLEFLSGGVEAEFVLPATAFDLDMASPPAKVVSLMTLNTRSDTPAFDPTVFTGTVIILEDNFVVATDLSDQLEDMGIETVITCATLQDGFDALAAEEVCCALLDINLGRSQTSETLAEALLERGIPFLFISGYGDSSILSDKLAAIPRLIKPLNPQMLKETLAEVMHPIAAPKGR